MPLIPAGYNMENPQLKRIHKIVREFPNGQQHMTKCGLIVSPPSPTTAHFRRTSQSVNCKGCK